MPLFIFHLAYLLAVGGSSGPTGTEGCRYADSGPPGAQAAP